MQKKILLSLLAVLSLAGCTGTESSSSQTSEENHESEVFNDPLLASNVQNFLKGFRMEGNIIQTRYQAELNDDFQYVPVGDPLETNTYYTDVAFNSGEENAFYKYSYRYLETNGEQVLVPAEGPYTYFEDENGYAYGETIDYSNTVVRTYPSSNNAHGLTFGDNGFYNFFSLLLEEDFTLNSEITSYTRYDLSIDKAAIIANNILYSLNSGAYALPTEAYIRADNGIFTQLHIELGPVASIDNITGGVSVITNSIVFTFSDIGEETITHLTPYEETEDSNNLKEALDQFAGQSFTMNVNHTSHATNIYTGEEENTSVTNIYGFTGEEIYVHEVGDNETSSTNLATDYYLAPISNTDERLYPYAYSEEENAFTLRNNGFTSEDGVVRFASGFCGLYLYDDLVPVIAGVSGALFTYDEENNVYEAKGETLSELTDCFLIASRPFRITGFAEASTLEVRLNDNNQLSSISVLYAYTDTLDGYIYQGSIDIAYSDVGSTTLEDFINL